VSEPTQSFCDAWTTPLELPDDPAARGPWKVGARMVEVAGLTVEVWYSAAAGSTDGLGGDGLLWLPPHDRRPRLENHALSGPPSQQPPPSLLPAPWLHSPTPRFMNLQLRNVSGSVGTGGGGRDRQPPPSVVRTMGPRCPCHLRRRCLQRRPLHPCRRCLRAHLSRHHRQRSQSAPPRRYMRPSLTVFA